MTVLRDYFVLTALLSTATSLNGNAYDPWALEVLPTSTCDFEFCYDATVSRVGNISNDARASTRDSPGLYLIPAKDLLLQIVQPERCFMACIGKMNVSNDELLTQDSIPNTATLHCLDNLSVFLCIATCMWHVNSHWPNFYASLELGEGIENFDLYNPYKEIQSHRIRQQLLSFTSMGNESVKHDERYRELDDILRNLPARPQCSDLCYTPEFGICASAFDGNIGKQECVSACLDSTICLAMCNETLTLSQTIRSDQQGSLPVPATPMQPPDVYLTDDIMLQKNSPALFYDISGAETDSAINATTPIGLIWKVEPADSADVLYYATHFRHPFDQSSKALETEDVYHLFIHYNHSGMAGYLRFVQFCQSANISYAFVNANGLSGFSPSTTVCFPGEYQPSPPQNMSIEANFNTQGLLEVNITYARSLDHDLVQSYEISATLQDGHHSGVHCPEGKLFNVTVPKSEGLSLVMSGRHLQEYNFTSVWNCNVTFMVLVNPRTPNATLKRYQESEDMVYRPKQMIASFLLQEVEILHPQVTYLLHNTYNCTSGHADVVIEGAVTSNSSNVSLKLEMFLNTLKAKLVKLNVLGQTLNEEEEQTLHFSSGDEVIGFNNVSPTSSGETYRLKINPGCCFIENTKYREIFTEQELTISINPVSPSNLQNLTVLHYTSDSGTVNFNISWLNSVFPHGNNSFNVLVATSNGTEVLSNQTIFHRSNGREAMVLPSQQLATLVMLPISKSGWYDFAVQAKSNWGAHSAWLNDSLFVEYHSAQPVGFPAYSVALPCAVGVVAAILLVVLIIACVCYYHRNKVVVIPTSSLFVENALTMDNGMDEEFPLHAMDSWELGPQDIIILGQLGEGNFGEVYRGLVKFEANAPAARYNSETLGNLLVAVKLLKSDATIVLKSEFLREIALMKKVSGDVCPYVVNMVGCCTHEEPIALVLEYASNGDLLHYLRAMRKLCDETEQVGSSENENQYVNGPETSACDDMLKDKDPPMATAGTESPEIEELTPANFISYGWQIASGMEYLSQLGIVHRDLACRNVLVCSNKQLKVSDFGLAREDECYIKTTDGKLPLRWMATESIQERVFTTKSDVWSFGVTLWEITTFGGHPYPTLGNRALLRYLLSGNTLERPKNCSEEWYHLMSLCWALNPHNRPHFKELRVNLEEMLSNVHQAHYIDLNAGTEYMPYYPMHASSVDESSEDDLPLQVSTGRFQTPYLEPQSYLDESTGEGPLLLRESQASDSSSNSTDEAMPAEDCCEDSQVADTHL